MLEVSLLAICYTIYTSSQRTEAGSGGISWAFPLVEGGETLPSSCSPLLATFDIASRGKGDRLRTSTFTLLSPLIIHVISSALGRCAREEWNEGRSPFTLFVGPPNRLRPAFKASTLSSGSYNCYHGSP